MTAIGKPLRAKKPAKPPKPRKAGREPFDGWRELVTPEGVDLRLRVGTYAERGLALLLDFLIISGVLGVLTIVLLIVAFATRVTWTNEVVAIVWLLGMFLGRNFYFFWFEARQRARDAGQAGHGTAGDHGRRRGPDRRRGVRAPTPCARSRCSCR